MDSILKSWLRPKFEDLNSQIELPSINFILN
jgi:hypothetical protein